MPTRRDFFASGGAALLSGAAMTTFPGSNAFASGLRAAPKITSRPTGMTALQHLGGSRSQYRSIQVANSGLATAMAAAGVESFLEKGVLTLKTATTPVAPLFQPLVVGPDPNCELDPEGKCQYPQGPPQDSWYLTLFFGGFGSGSSSGIWFGNTSYGHNDSNLNGYTHNIGPTYNYGPQPKPYPTHCIQEALAAAASSAITLVLAMRANPTFYQQILGNLYGQVVNLVEAFQSAELSGIALFTALAGLLTGSEFLVILAVVLGGYLTYAAWQHCIAGH